MPADIIIQNKIVQPGKQYIKVNKPGVAKSPGDAVVFKNVLPGNPEARITFYKMSDKGGTVISDFCQGQTNSYFAVPGAGNGEATCTLTKPEGNFAYSISTFPATYETLDPIIIIEPQKMQGAPAQQKSTVITSAIVGALIGAAVMFVLMKTVFGKGQSN